MVAAHLCVCVCVDILPDGFSTPRDGDGIKRWIKSAKSPLKAQVQNARSATGFVRVRVRSASSLSDRIFASPLCP